MLQTAYLKPAQTELTTRISGFPDEPERGSF
jgi:hypothetical protein